MTTTTQSRFSGHTRPLLDTVSTKIAKKAPLCELCAERHLLNAKGSQKETYHMAVDLAGSGMNYTVGDSIGVFVRHADELVDRTLRACRAIGDEMLVDRPQSSRPL